ncbi:transglycosylase domain-containing protein [Nocardioides sp. zg-536]|uniref:Transglycosylase domain-containing protein n=1 Tax=Nocardioides faecalis TaxID=2803858 RepID=A0A938Y823_9ACTN|nr:transglycosylase domain-containing protein [Nocardioides faecalis]MBM9461000.1 transglycosylase domain-containing protein [Nocardioides faecalis]MBS4752094.1 transglycosylase domain-containing protein [Nocardioides faecalis]QVI59096.1 transglycosylase domain-containing protein [Nocardioides faecalis]
MSRTRPDRLPPGRIASHLGVMLLVAAVLGVVVSGLAIPFAGVAGFTARNLAESVDDLPQELETEQLPQRTEIKDVRGTTIATLYDQNRVNVPLRQISRTMVEAMVAIEDYRFYQHGALDLKGTMRALFTNQASGGVAQGGSSITQQLVKLTLVNQAKTDEERRAATDDTYGRKLRELRYAIALEKRHTKDWILERYLNTAYFGDGAYGVQAAAQHYFSVNAKDLNLRQAALLAGLVQSPEAYNPTKYPAQAKVRRNIVLQRMAQLGVITDEEAAKTKERRLGLKVAEQRNGCVNSPAQFYCDFAVRWLKEDPALGETPEERERLIFSGGLTIRTPLDMRHQRAATESVASKVYPEDAAIGALALIEPRTGNVKAIAQSRPMGKRKGQTFLNYTVPRQYGDAAGFQPGSTFKAFVLTAAIMQDIPLNQRIPAPKQISVSLRDFETCDGPYRSAEVWRPKNSTTASAAPNLYEGTQKSVNTFFVNLERMTGICEPWKLARAMGISRLTKDNIVPSFTLGVADVSPLEMAEAYATFAAGGVHCDARPVTQIEDIDGNVLKKYPKSCTQVFASPVADAVNDVLRGVVAPGGFGAALNPGKPAAGKTGTTSDNKAVWFVGYTPTLAGAATVAGLNKAGQPETLNGRSIGGRTLYSTSGSTTAGPIWGDAFKKIAPFLEDKDFNRPSSTDIRGLLTPVPDVGGKTYDEAEDILSDLGFDVVRGSTVDSSYSRGLVASTAPRAGTGLAGGDKVTVYISDGSPKKAKKKRKKGGD